MSTRHHEYKCWPVYFQAVWTGRKLFEVRATREGDGPVARDPRVGDTVMLREYDRAAMEYTGRQVQVYVIYVIEGGRFGLEEGHIIFGFKPKITKGGDS